MRDQNSLSRSKLSILKKKPSKLQLTKWIKRTKTCKKKCFQNIYHHILLFSLVGNNYFMCLNSFKWDYEWMEYLIGSYINICRNWENSCFNFKNENKKLLFMNRIKKFFFAFRKILLYCDRIRYIISRHVP